MDEKGRLSRQAFAAACQDLFADQAGSATDELSLRALAGWRWQESPHMQGYGYLVRDPLHRLAASVPSEWQDTDDLVALEPCDPTARTTAADDLDEAAVVVSPTAGRASPTSAQAVKVVLYAVYSDTYRVPSLFFTATFESNGAPLDLQALLRSNVFTSSPTSTSRYPFTTLDPPPSSGEASVVLPFLTTAEHPTTGLPCWAVHPCNTADLLDDVLGRGEVSGEEYMRAWLMVVGSLVDLREDATC